MKARLCILLLPALLAGCAVPLLGLTATANYYCWGIFSMAAVSLLAGGRAGRLKAGRG